MQLEIIEKCIGWQQILCSFKLLKISSPEVRRHGERITCVTGAVLPCRVKDSTGSTTA